MRKVVLLLSVAMIGLMLACGYLSRELSMHDWHRRYVVTYAIDTDTGRGYIHLPGTDEGDVYKRNVFSIYRGVEGQWFNAMPEWENLVRPTIEEMEEGESTSWYLFASALLHQQHRA